METNENNGYKEIRVNRDSIIKKVKESTERVESILIISLMLMVVQE